MTPPPSHETLFARHTAGDAQALGELATRLSPELRRLARRMGADREQSFDAVQDTWLAVLRSSGRFEADRPLKPWLHAILRFRWRSTRRRERRVPAQTSLELVETIADASERRDLAAGETVELVRRALADLPERYRAVLVLHLVEGLSPIEIAERLALPRSSVRVLLHRGRTMLQRTLPRGAFAFVLALALRRRAQAQPRWVATLVAAVVVCASFVALRWASASWPSDSDVRTSVAASMDPTAPSSPLAELEVVASSNERFEVNEPDELEVFVRNTRGDGIANVGVEVERLDGSDPRLERRFAVTDSAGRARLPRPIGVALRVRTDRGVGADVEAGAPRCELTAASGVRVNGRVVDDTGRALGGAAIWLGDLAGSRRGQVVAFAGADGSFELFDVPQRASLAALPRFHVRTPMIAVPKADASGEVKLELVARRGGASVVVVAFDSQGEPLADARILVGRDVDGKPPQLAQGLLPAFPPSLEALSAANGRAELGGLEPGVHDVVVRARGHAPWSTTIAVVGDESHHVDARLELGAVLSGRVVDESGRALGGAQVAWSNGDSLATTHVLAASDGRFVFDGIPASTAFVAARAFDHGVAETEVRLSRGANDDLTLTLTALPLCVGTLHDDVGAPLADFDVRLLGHVTHPLAPEADDDRTNSAGEFELAVPGGEIRRIEVRGPGWPDWTVVRRSWLNGDGRTLRICVPSDALPRAWMRGTLRDASGRPLGDRTIDLVRRDTAGRANLLRAVARTTSDGRVEVGPLAEGDYELLLARDEHSLEELFGWIGRVRLEREDELDISRSLPEASALSCKLHFDDHSAPTTPIVALSMPGASFELATWTVAEQSLRVLPGHYELKAMGEEFAWIDAHAVAIEPSANVVWEPELERACATRLELAEWPDDVDREAGVVLSRERDGRAVGRFAMSKGDEQRQSLHCFLSPGSYRAWVRRRDGQAVSTPFDVAQGGENRFELRWNR